MYFLIKILLMALLLLVGIIYFLPSLIARNRRHHNRTAILVLNFCFGWSFVGWVASLIWALTKVESEKFCNPHVHHYAPGSTLITTQEK